MSGPTVTSRPVARQLMPSSRYRNPGDMVGLIAGTALFAAALITIAAAHATVLGPEAATWSVLHTGQAARALTGIVQVAVCAGGATVLLALLLLPRLRLLAGLVVAGASAAAATTGILVLTGNGHPRSEERRVGKECRSR